MLYEVITNSENIAEVIEIEEKKAAKEKEKKKEEGKRKDKKKGKKQKKALKEHTAISFIGKKKGKNRQAVWVSKFTLKYEEELQKLQIELLKWQKHVIDKEQKVLLIFEGRDAAGKGGTIKRIVEHLNPRGARVVALLNRITSYNVCYTKLLRCRWAKASSASADRSRARRSGCAVRPV